MWQHVKRVWTDDNWLVFSAVVVVSLVATRRIGGARFSIYYHFIDSKVLGWGSTNGRKSDSKDLAGAVKDHFIGCTLLKSKLLHFWTPIFWLYWATCCQYLDEFSMSCYWHFLKWLNDSHVRGWDHHSDDSSISQISQFLADTVKFRQNKVEDVMTSPSFPFQELLPSLSSRARLLGKPCCCWSLMAFSHDIRTFRITTFFPTIYNLASIVVVELSLATFYYPLSDWLISSFWLIALTSFFSESTTSVCQS